MLRAAEAKHGVPLDAAFREWDSNRDGMISPQELRQGLDSLGVFKGVQDADAQKLLNRIDLDASGNLSLAEFLRFAGCNYVACCKELRTILLAAEARHDARLRSEWDSSDNGFITDTELKAGLRA